MLVQQFIQVRRQFPGYEDGAVVTGIVSAPICFQFLPIKLQIVFG